MEEGVSAFKSQFKRLYPIKSNKSKGPEARSGHRILVNDGDIYCYGGYNPQEPNQTNNGRNMEEFPMFRDLWKYNIASQTWRRLSTTGTIPRESASYAALLDNKKLFVFGGTGFPFAEVRNNKLFCCDLVKLSWSILPCKGTLPKKVYGHAMLLLRGCIYLFGGTTGFYYSNDMFRLNLSTLVWEKINSPTIIDCAPSPRYRHEIATDGKEIFVFGGGAAQTAEQLDVVWAFNVESNKWRIIQTVADPKNGFPLPRKCHGCVQDARYVYLTGGLGDGNSLAFKDVWRFDLEMYSWVKMSMQLRKEVYFHATAISSCNTMYTFGGVLMQEASTQRSKCLYKVDLTVKRLAELCWEKITCYPDVLKQSSRSLLEMGIPMHFLSRLDTQIDDDTTQEMVASAS